MANRSELAKRTKAVRRDVDLRGLVATVLPVSAGGHARCPFHGSISHSLYVGKRSWWCWGCGAGGNAIAFVRDYFGLGQLPALARLEAESGLAPPTASCRRARSGRAVWPHGEPVRPINIARYLMASTEDDRTLVRLRLLSRGVPIGMLGDEWLRHLRYSPRAPRVAWTEDGAASDVSWAPAVVAAIRRPTLTSRGEVKLKPIGVQATYFPLDEADAGAGELSTPVRKIFGEHVGGGVVIGTYRPDAPLYVGTSIEAVMSGMAAANAGADACGLAVLHLSNMQGSRFADRGALPLWGGRIDPTRPGTAFAHQGPVIGLVDHNLPALGARPCPITRERGVRVVDRQNGPVRERVISSSERREICSRFFTEIWRAAGSRDVRTVLASALSEGGAS